SQLRIFAKQSLEGFDVTGDGRFQSQFEWKDEGVLAIQRLDVLLQLPPTLEAMPASDDRLRISKRNPDALNLRIRYAVSIISPPPAAEARVMLSDAIHRLCGA